MKSVLLMIAFAALVCGCSSMPGNVSSTSSKLDGERQVSIKPGWLYAGGMNLPTAKLGGFWTEKSPENFMMEAVISTIDNVEGLRIGVDGKISEFKPAEQFTSFRYEPDVINSLGYYPGETESGKRFVVPLEFVEQMLAGKKVIVQIQLSRGFVEGEFSFSQTSYAKPAFRKALSQIKGVTAQAKN